MGFLRLTGVVLVVAMSAAMACGGVYTASERVPFPVEASGAVQELAFEPQFQQLLDDRLFVADPARPREVDGKPTRRGVALDLLAKAEGLERNALQLRLGEVEAALNDLAPRSRDRAPDFLALILLAHAHAERGEWADAARIHSAAFFDAEPPPTLPGATPEQTRWLLRVERVYVKRYYDLKKRQAALKRTEWLTRPALELFPGVTFAELGGTDLERARLPADAVAIVQQLLLWSPLDTDLLWLLGELYAANGEFRLAEKIFDQCTWGRSYTDRQVLMDHRRQVQTVVKALPPEQPVEIPDAPETPVAAAPERTAADLLAQYWPVPAGFALVTALMLTLQVRAWRRRLGR